MISSKKVTGLLILAVGLWASTAGAVDLDTVAYVTMVEGITIVEDTALNFGDVALNDGTVTIGTDGSVTDPNFISYDATNVSQGIFTVTAIAGGTYDISLMENIPVVGLLLNNFHLSIDGGADEVGTDTFLGVTLANQISAFNIGADLTVDSANAVLGANQTIGYRLTVNFN